MPENCKTIEEVRQAIDEIDQQILQLFAKRFSFVERIVDFKKSEEGIIAEDRQKEVFTRRREWATKLGLDPDTFEEMYKILVEHNIRRELKIFNEQNK